MNEYKASETFSMIWTSIKWIQLKDWMLRFKQKPEWNILEEWNEIRIHEYVFVFDTLCVVKDVDTYVILWFGKIKLNYMFTNCAYGLRYNAAKIEWHKENSCASSRISSDMHWIILFYFITFHNYIAIWFYYIHKGGSETVQSRRKLIFLLTQTKRKIFSGIWLFLS